VKPDPPKFIVEAGLFPLCKALRMLGFDSLYRGNLSPSEAIQRAIEEQRIWIRSQPQELNLQYGIRYYVVLSSEVAAQLAEMDLQLNLHSGAYPLSLCLKCNYPIDSIPKSAAQGGVPERVFTDFDLFYRCPRCRRFYWPGSHYQKMQAKVNSWGLLGG
jgi:uncharacterized protein with PIN domain